MKISLRWMADYINAQNAWEHLLAHERALKENLPLAGLEVNALKSPGADIADVIVARIDQFTKHPEADRLNICQVNTGKEVHQVICGAPNVRKDMFVAFAPEGSVLPGPFRIKKAKIRGVNSFGMLCSETELALGEESSGIMDLPSNLKLGAKLVDEMPLTDEIWEFELTPDRSDCLSFKGLAREIKRYIGFDYKEAPKETWGQESGIAPVKLELVASEACPYYGVQLFENLAVKETPDWIKKRLESIELRPHNPIVDIANYVLMELGHPVHTFDADKIAGSKLIVRFAKDNEKITTLDGVERSLCSKDLVIADLDKPVALAGMMGSLDSAVDENTTRVLLESAYFDSNVIRSMVQRHQIHSDASHRFERGVDPSQIKAAAERIAYLYDKELNFKKKGSFLVEENKKLSKKLFKKREINLDLRALKRVLGMEFSSEELHRQLSQVDIESQSKSANVLTVTVPLHRNDLKREIDLIEEVARVVGYQRIPSRYPLNKAPLQGRSSSLYDRRVKLRHFFKKVSMTEVMPFCFSSEKEWNFAPSHPAVKLRNPLSEDWSSMRGNLALGLCRVAKRHFALDQKNLSCFELGNVFSKVEEEKDKDPLSRKCQESFHAAFLQTGAVRDLHWSDGSQKRNYDFFDAKGVVESFRAQVGVWDSRWKGLKIKALHDFTEEELESSLPTWMPAKLFHPTRTALWGIPGKKAWTLYGFLTVLHPDHQRDLLDLRAGFHPELQLAEFRLMEDLWTHDNLKKVDKENNSLGRNSIKVLSKFPGVERDLSLVLKKDVLVGDLISKLQREGGNLVKSLKCVDVYSLDESTHSLTLRMELQSIEKTLEEEEIEQSLQKILKSAKKNFSAELR